MIDKLLYLDRDYISNKYEEITGTSPKVKITKTEGLNAGVKLPLFSGGASAVESKSYENSTNSMLDKLRSDLEKIPNFINGNHDLGKPSSYCWVCGEMTVNKISLKRNKFTLNLIGKNNNGKKSEEELVSEESYFAVKDYEGNKFSLLINPDYLASGLKQLCEISSLIADEVLFPVMALLRVLPARNAFQEWASIPLVIYENANQPINADGK